MRVVIGEDGVLLRSGIASLLAADGMDVVGTAGDLDGLLALVTQARPEAVVLDIRMPPTYTDEGLQAAERIRAEHGRDVGILILSQHLEPRFALNLVTRAEGGFGYLLKERIAEVDDFVDAVRRVARGGSVVDPEVVRAILARPDRGGLDALTERELEVLGLMAAGRSNAAIAERLGIGAKTVEMHTNTIFSKLALEPAADDNRRVLAVLAYLGHPSGQAAPRRASAPWP